MDEDRTRAPRLSPGHGLHPVAVTYWRSLWAEGYGEHFTATERTMARELAHLVSGYEHADDPKLRIRLSHAIRDLRSDLGLLDGDAIRMRRLRRSDFTAGSLSAAHA